MGESSARINAHFDYRYDVLNRKIGILYKDCPQDIRTAVSGYCSKDSNAQTHTPSFISNMVWFTEFLEINSILKAKVYATTQRKTDLLF